MNDDTCLVLNNTQEKKALEKRVELLEAQLDAALDVIHDMNRLIYRLSDEDK